MRIFQGKKYMLEVKCALRYLHVQSLIIAGDLSLLLADLDDRG